jgi:uncharacterized membrane protein
MVTAAKTTSQIAIHMTVAFAVMYFVTGSVAFGGIAALIEPLMLPLHDRLWEKIRQRVEARQGPRAPRIAGGAVQPA